MNIRQFTFSALMLATLSQSAMAADNASPAQHAEKMGSVSATASSLDSLENKLARLTKASGATSYKIIFANGNNDIRGVALTYK
ncbi:YdgH/BhsA/McbA-like domain containing protein [Dickeya lacustris]|uniref:DUF1471 domain-containing protein n=1 Tax=Dickeya lacustris TaxID=2259638 RepID=A0ABY8GBG4_9GAMM|nr:YdgH/BhsA/McbA-like domain containing protein [Dickeya lacustris]WFN57255.1 DUF1471 domain-containing protein [Dickeya lacustris]